MPLDHAPVNTIAPLRNVAALLELVERLKARDPNLPGIGVHYGPSGAGKSFAAMYVANKTRAYHVEVKSVTTRKHLAVSILKDMGIAPAKTIPEMIEQIGEQLTLSGRPLIVDEADILVDKGLIHVIKDIYECSHGSIVLIGEEKLPMKLRPIERIHGRVYDWTPTLPATIADAGHLAKLYARGVTIADDLLKAVHDASQASVRRICINLARAAEAAQGAALDSIDLNAWQDQGGVFFTGNPPPRGEG
ncbi:MAG: ATP-binding protein [Magnetospirillum sp.]|nr:ATP-binding protein [Magnetospirillum sp.]